MASLLLIIILFNVSSTRVFGEYNNEDFILYAGRRINKTSDVDHLTAVSQIECLSSCLSSGRCCAVSYSPVTNACLLDVNDMCCTETAHDNNWNLWVKSGNIRKHLPVNVGNLTVQKPIDCGDVHGESGVYTIYGACPEYGFDVLCDMGTDGGGWTEYKHVTFCDLRKEFWIGNKHLCEMTSQHSYGLRVDLEDFDNRTRYAQYETFYIGNSNDKYRLTIGNYSGDAGDSMVNANGMNFSTKDQDNDKASFQCALTFNGAWWYYMYACLQANLNGLYLGGPHTSYADGIEWRTWKGFYYSLKSVKMMIRRH